MLPDDEQADLDLVAAFLVGKGLSPEPFSREEMQTGRTPDFRVRRDGEIVAYCEVKSPNDPWLDNKLRAAPAEVIVGGARPDPTFNRLARLLSKADSQFLAVNPSQIQYNILAYVNHDKMSRYSDLVETLTGYFHTSDGARISTLRHIAEDRIGEAKRRIDACLWFEGKDLKGVVVNDADLDRTSRFCRLLAFDQANIKC